MAGHQHVELTGARIRERTMWGSSTAKHGSPSLIAHFVEHLQRR